MKLSELVKDIPVMGVYGSLDIEITGVSIDSRRIGQGYMFIAVKGTQTDGCKFIDSAVEKGAAAVLYDGETERKNGGET